MFLRHLTAELPIQNVVLPFDKSHCTLYS